MVSFPDAHLHRVATAARQSAMVATTFPTGWAQLIVVAEGYFLREITEGLQVTGLPSRCQIAGELTRVHLNLDDSITDLNAFRPILRAELEPFIIGVGQTVCRDIPEGIVICRVGDGRW
jgi:hypothetical protein